MLKENLTWRSFADAGRLGRGAIAASWNFTATPTLYIIDHKGIIRRKWMASPGERAIDRALEKMIQAAERDGKRPPK